MSIWDLLPAFFWEGPPLPRCMNIKWPWAQASPSASATGLAGLFNESSKMTPARENKQVVSTSAQTSELTTYQNTETVEFPDGFDPDTFMPRKIVIHRSAKVSK